MNRFELFIALRYLRAKRKQAVISVITVISVLLAKETRGTALDEPPVPAGAAVSGLPANVKASAVTP